MKHKIECDAHFKSNDELCENEHKEHDDLWEHCSNTLEGNLECWEDLKQHTISQ